MKLLTAIASATTAAVLATAGVAVAGASSNSGTSAGSPAVSAASLDRAALKHPRLARRLLRGAIVVSAKTIGVTPKALVSELRSGKTVADVATEHGKQPQDVVDALVSAGTKLIEKAKDAGKISAERAAKLEAALPGRAAKFVNTWHPRAKKTAA